jgi:hypothetical protein
MKFVNDVIGMIENPNYNCMIKIITIFHNNEILN